MSEISLEALHLAAQAVDDALDDYRYAEETQSRLLLSVRDGAIQRFEVAMDLTRQLVIRVLKEKYAMDEASAKLAGCPFIHAAYGFGSAKEPLATIKTPLELVRALNQESN